MCAYGLRGAYVVCLSTSMVSGEWNMDDLSIFMATMLSYDGCPAEPTPVAPAPGRDCPCACVGTGCPPSCGEAPGGSGKLADVPDGVGNPVKLGVVGLC